MQVKVERIDEQHSQSPSLAWRDEAAEEPWLRIVQRRHPASTFETGLVRREGPLQLEIGATWSISLTTAQSVTLVLFYDHTTALCYLQRLSGL